MQADEDLCGGYRKHKRSPDRSRVIKTPNFRQLFYQIKKFSIYVTFLLAGSANSQIKIFLKEYRQFNFVLSFVLQYWGRKTPLLKTC